MTDGDRSTELTPLTLEGLQKLRDLVDALKGHTGPWGTGRGGEETRPGVMQMPWMEETDVARRAMRWLYDAERILGFDWPGWDEGREIFANWTDETADSLDHLTVCKLLTAVARNDRFHDGAWSGMFEHGPGVVLFARLLVCEEELARRG